MTQYLVHEDSCRARGGRVTKKMVSGRNRAALSVQAWAHDPCFPGPPPASGSASPPWDREAGSLPQPPLPRSQPGHHLYWSWERRFGVHTPCPMARAAVDQPVGSLEASMASHDDTTEWAAGVPQLLRGGGVVFYLGTGTFISGRSQWGLLMLPRPANPPLSWEQEDGVCRLAAMHTRHRPPPAGQSRMATRKGRGPYTLG